MSCEVGGELVRTISRGGREETSLGDLQAIIDAMESSAWDSYQDFYKFNRSCQWHTLHNHVRLQITRLAIVENAHGENYIHLWVIAAKSCRFVTWTGIYQYWDTSCLSVQKYVWYWKLPIMRCGSNHSERNPSTQCSTFRLTYTKQVSKQTASGQWT